VLALIGYGYKNHAGGGGQGGDFLTNLIVKKYYLYRFPLRGINP